MAYSTASCFKVVSKCLPTCFVFEDKSKKLQATWKRQDKTKNPFCHCVSVEGGGEWIEAIQKDRAEAIKIIKNTFEKEKFLYNEKGEDKKISPEERNRFRQKYKTVSAEDERGFQCRGCKVVLHSPETEALEEFEGTTACWDLNKRGEVGETALHVCLLLDSPLHRKLVNLLMEIYPKLSLDVYEGPEYLGESGLHLAIVHGNFDAVKKLVKNGGSVHDIARGRFFMPEDQKANITGNTNYLGYAYYGEYPLAFAACLGQEDIYDYLLQHEARPNAKDTFGNTVLHMCVIHNQPKMFSHSLKIDEEQKYRAYLLEKNDEGLDPLMLAAKMGHDKMFEAVLYHHSRTVWSWHNITCSFYSLESLDTINEQGHQNSQSALEYIIDNESEGHLAMLDNPVVSQLIEEKWKAYGQFHFYVRLMFAIIHLTALSVIVWSPPGRFRDLATPTDGLNIARIFAWVVLFLSSVLQLLHYIFIQLGLVQLPGIVMRRNKNPVSFSEVKHSLPNPLYAPFKIIFQISCALVIASGILDIRGHDGLASVLLALATPAAWSYLLFFARTQRLLGPFVAMIYKMCVTDVVKFAIIFLVFLIQFSQGFYFLFKDPDNQNERFDSLWGTTMTVLQMTLGQFNFVDLNDSHIPVLAKVLFLAFALLLPILLLNMLIAMMGNTYRNIISGANRHWKRQWAQVVVMLEYTIPACSLRRYLDKYATDAQCSNQLDKKAIMLIIHQKHGVQN